MSGSGTSRSKSETGTTSSSSSSTDNYVVIDRWTNNITYRHLLISSCVGIMQFWWHPYVQNPRAFIPFIFLYNTFSLFCGYPMFYFELALGIVTKKGVLKCWDLAPITRGVGLSMLATCAFTAFALSIVSAYCLALLVHSIHSFLPWLHCAAAADSPCAARHRPLNIDSEVPAQSFFHNFVLNLKRDGLERGMGSVVTELTVYHIIVWIVVYLIAFKKIYSYSKLLFLKDSLAYFVLMCAVLGTLRLDGARVMFNQCDWNVLLEDPHIWRRAVEYALLEMTISQGSLIMLGSYCPKEPLKLSHTALFAFIVSKTMTIGSAFVLAATHGALQVDYGSSSNITSVPAAYSLIMWSDFVARVPGSQFWSALIFFTMFVLSVTSVALLVQTIMSTFTGKVVRKISWAFLILICVLFCFIGIFTLCTQSGVLILDFLMYWPVSMPRIFIAAINMMVVTYIYGQTTFCEDLFFSIGEYPNIFLRICWALTPGFLVGMSLTGVGNWPEGKIAGWMLNLFCLMPMLSVFLCYLIFRCRVRNIMGTEK